MGRLTTAWTVWRIPNNKARIKNRNEDLRNQRVRTGMFFQSTPFHGGVILKR
jgi:hypothetical protein